MVTIITAVYNNGKLIIESLQALKQQTYRDYEHILIDDCSTDNSFDLIETWAKENNHKYRLLRIHITAALRLLSILP